MLLIVIVLDLWTAGNWNYSPGNFLQRLNTFPSSCHLYPIPGHSISQSQNNGRRRNVCNLGLLLLKPSNNNQHWPDLFYQNLYHGKLAELEWTVTASLDAYPRWYRALKSIMWSLELKLVDTSVTNGKPLINRYLKTFNKNLSPVSYLIVVRYDWKTVFGQQM